MFSTAEKTTKPSTAVQQKTAGQSFFRKAAGEHFFGPSESQSQSHSFFSPSVQAKLSVSQPDDPQEKEADAVADKVMRMAEPVAASESSGGQEELQRKEEEEKPAIQAKTEEKEKEVHRSAETGHTLAAGISLQRKGAAEDKEKMQAKLFSHVQRQMDTGSGSQHEASASDGADVDVHAKLSDVQRSHILMRSGRGPPSQGTTTQSFESSLTTSKGGGSPMSADTQTFMENRFGADFSGVRIHTGSQAENLSRSINAHAFTHGNDIYFNSGKYSPNTPEGGTLLAHELTHTIQQGASSAAPHSVAARSIQRKNIARKIQRQEASTQRNAAVEFAKAEQGKVSANKTGPDGKRFGWERLLEYFKTTFGPDKVLPEGAAMQPGTVNEGQIKVKSTFNGDVMDPGNGTTVLHNQPRDAMPSWCGIFAFWALNKGGIPLKKWELGGSMIPPEAAYPGGYQPVAGDIAYRKEFSHYALVVSSDGTNVTSMNGNTSGEDNLGGEIQLQTHPKDHWFVYFNPTMMMDGSLRSPGAAPGAAKPRSLKELRKKLFNVQAKSQETTENEEHEHQVQAKTDTTVQKQADTSAPTATDTAVTASQPVAAVTESAKEQAPEKEKEQDLAPASGQFDVHRSFDNGRQPQNDEKVQAKCDCGGKQETDRNIQRQEDKKEDKPETTVQRQAEAAHSRGPPRGPPQIQAKLGGKAIQRWSLRGAWDAVSGFVSEAAAWVEKGIDAAKEWLLGKVRDFVSHIPGYKVLCLILGEDPITGEEATLTGASLLEAGLDIIPFGHMFRALLNRLGIYNDVATWLQGRIGDMSSLASGIGARFDQFWDRLSLDDVGDPEGVMNRVADLLRGTINDIVGFCERSASTFLDMIKRVMIREIAAFVRARVPRLFPLLTVALGFNPETMETVQRNGTNILNALLEVSDEGQEQRRQMMETGTFQRIAGWIDRGIAVFSTAYRQLMAAFRNIWNYVTVENLFHPVDTFTRIYNEFSEPVRLVGRFLIDAAVEILRVIKDALLGRLSEYAKQTKGYSLICVIIGRDPFTGQRVPRTVHNLVKGFMSLMDGGEQQYEQLKQSGAIDRIVNKVMAAVARLNMTPQAIIQLFYDLWNNVFTLQTLRNPIAAFRRIVDTFGQPIMRLIRFVIEILMIVVEAILILMNFPFDLIQNIIAKARQAYQMIKRDPVGFFKNLLRAIKQGFIQFFDNIGTHLWNGLKQWFMSEVQAAGIPIPTDFSLMGILKWLLVVLDITMEKIWKKLEERIGAEKVAKIRRVIERVEQLAETAGEVYAFIQDVQNRGFVAVIVDKIKEKVSNAWDMVMEAAKGFIMDQIISKVTAKLLSMLDPTGIMAVINSAIAIYKAIQSFIRYLRQMLEIVNSFVEGLVEIAGGNIAKAANFVEGSLARGVPIAIGFLANQVGLNLSERLKDIVELVREKVDKGLTWVIDKLATLVERLVAFGRSAANRVLSLLGLKKQFRLNNGEEHTLKFSGDNPGARLMIESTPTPLEHHIGTLRSTYTTKEAKDELDKIDTLISEINTLKAETMTPTRGESIRQKLEQIATHLQHTAFGGNENLPPSKVTFTETNKAGGVVGHIMEAKPLSLNPGTNNKGGANVGSEPVDAGNTLLWDKVKVRRNTYIQGHLLNHHVGGSGAIKENLVPLRGPFNTRMESNFETHVKNSVLGSKHVLHYKVEAIFGTHSPPRVHLPEEAELPTALKFTMKKMEKKAGTTGLEPDHWEVPSGAKDLYTADNPMEHKLDPDSPVTAAATLDFTTLHTEAKTSTLTYNGFINQDVIHKRSFEPTAPVPLTSAQIDQIEKLFTDREESQGRAIELERVKNLTSITTFDVFKGDRAFYKNAGHKLSDYDGAYVEIKDKFDQKQIQLKNDERASQKAIEMGRIVPGMPITTWAAFTGPKVFYSTVDQDYNEVKKAFEDEQKKSRAKVLDDVLAEVKNIPETTKPYHGITWQSFKRDKGIGFSTSEATEVGKLSTIETEFRKRQ